MLKSFLFWGMLLTARLSGNEQPNILPYEGGDIQISSDISEYDSLTAGKPIEGTIMITHDTKDKVDKASFKMGNLAIQVEFLKTTPITSYSPLAVSIYNFKIEGKEVGTYTLPPISVSVGGKTYQAPPLSVIIDN